MRPEHRVLDRRVWVTIVIRVTVMVAVFARPPDRPALQRRTTDRADNELEPTAGFVRTVCKVTVKTRGKCPDAERVCNGAQDQRGPGRLDEENARNRKVNRDEREQVHPFGDFFQNLNDRFFLRGSRESGPG